MRSIFRKSLWLAFALSCSAAHAQWTNEQVIHTTNLYSTKQTSPKVSCANYSVGKVIDCVYPDYSATVGNTAVFEIQSADGGVSWGAPSLVSNEVAYDPYIEYDSNRQRLNLIYATNTGGYNNNIVIRTRSGVASAWSASTTIAAGNAANEYWIPNVLTLQDGNMLATMTVNGPESQSGVGSGRIMWSLSTNGGASWTAPAAITETCDAEYSHRRCQVA
jgi:hypothetical protein